MSEPLSVEERAAEEAVYDVGEPVSAAEIPYRGQYRYEHIYEVALQMKRGEAIPIRFSGRQYAEYAYTACKRFFDWHHEKRFRLFHRDRTLWIERLLD